MPKYYDQDCRYIKNGSLKDTMKIVIPKKWIGIRAQSIVNAWAQLVKRKSEKINISNKYEPSLRKRLFVKSSKFLLIDYSVILLLIDYSV